MIHAYYRTLNLREYEKAWGVLGRQYREKKIDLPKFVEGFQKTVTHSRVRTRVLGTSGGVVAIYANVTAIEQDGPTTSPRGHCYLFYLQQEPLAKPHEDFVSVPWARLTKQDWRVVLINVRGECHYFGL